jgi:hypothetical protein
MIDDDELALREALALSMVSAPVEVEAKPSEEAKKDE